MKNTYTTLLSLFVTISLAQTIDYEIKSFAGRYIKWNSTQNYYPTDPSDISDIYGFWSEQFTINLYVHENMIISDNRPDIDLNNAISSWNAVSNLAKINKIGTFSGSSTAYDQGKSKVFIDNFGAFFSLDQNHENGPLAATTHWALHYTEADCNHPAWGNGPILLGGLIAINPDADFYYGSLPEGISMSFYTTILHELGHLLGLNHLSNRVNVMFHALKRKDYKILTIDEEKHINRLYGHDGLNNASQNDPKYSSIECTHFDIKIKGLIGIREDGTYVHIDENNYINNPDPCNNCISDPGEDGVDCGGACPDDCKTKQTGNTISKYYVEDNAVLLDFTVVQNHIKVESLSTTGKIEILDGDSKYMRAGEYIEIGRGFSTEIGSTFEAEIGSSINSGICDFYYPNIFTPNCDGINDYLSFYVTGASKYEVFIKNYDNNLSDVYHGLGNIYTNKVIAWNFIDVNQGNQLDNRYFYYLIRFMDANTGNWVGDPDKNSANPQDWHLGYISGDFAPCPHEPYGQYLKSSTPNHLTNNNLLDNVRIFPNPSKGILFIESSESIYSLEVYTSTGNILYKKDNFEATKTMIDLSSYSSGTYFIRVNNQVKHFTLVN